MKFRKSFQRRRHARGVALLSVSIFALSSAAVADETTTYTYDPLGRLVGASSSGTANNGLGLAYTYDATGNRVSYEVTGSSNQGVPERIVIVVPSSPSPSASGYTVIPIDQ